MWRDHLKLNFVVLVWSFTAILGAWIAMPRFELVFLRTFFAALLLWTFQQWRRRHLMERGISIHPPKRPALLLANGVIIGLHWIFFFTAAGMSPSICLAGLATTTLWIALLQPFFRRTRWNALELVLGALIAAALGLMYRYHGNAPALLAGLASAAAAAVFSIINGIIAKGEDPVAVTVLEMTGASAFCLLALLVSLASGHLTLAELPPRPTDWLWMSLLVVLCTAYAYVAYIALLRALSVFTISLASNLEPVYGMLLAAALLGEHKTLSPMFYLSSAIIVACVLLYIVLNRFRSERT